MSYNIYLHIEHKVSEGNLNACHGTSAAPGDEVWPQDGQQCAEPVSTSVHHGNRGETKGMKEAH